MIEKLQAYYFLTNLGIYTLFYELNIRTKNVPLLP